MILGTLSAGGSSILAILGTFLTGLLGIVL
jgi:hypothetical protein